MKEFFKKQFENKINYFVITLSFVCFVIILLWAVLFKCNNSENFTLSTQQIVNWNISKRFLYQFEDGVFKHNSVGLVILNTFIFLPMGLYLPLLFKKYNFWRDFFITFLCVLFVETFQLFTGLGCFEYIDFICNLAGFLMGTLIFKLLRKFTKDKVINYVNLAIVIFALPFSVYCLVNTITNYQMYAIFFDGTSFKSLFNF